MIHKECSGTVLVDVTSSYKMLANITQNQTSDGLRTVEIHCYNTKEECEGLVFWCLKCDDEVSLDDIHFSCRSCGENMPVEDGLVALDSGGIWCDSCIQSRCDGEENVALLNIYATDSVVLT